MTLFRGKKKKRKMLIFTQNSEKTSRSEDQRRDVAPVTQRALGFKGRVLFCWGFFFSGLIFSNKMPDSERIFLGDWAADLHFKMSLIVLQIKVLLKIYEKGCCGKRGFETSTY